MFRIIVNYAIRNIVRTRLRSFFTIFTVSLIIMLYTVLTSVGDSFTKQVSQVLNQQDIDIVVQARYATSPVSSIIGLDTVNELLAIDEVKSHDSIIIGRKRIEDKSSIFIMGSSNFISLRNRLGLNMIQGASFFNEKHEVIIGENMAKVFDLEIGSYIKLNSENEYKVVGIYSSWLKFLNSGVMSGLKTTQEILGKQDQISLLFITLKDTTTTSSVLKHINESFPQIRAIESQQLPNSIGLVKNIFYFSKIVSVLTLVIAVAVLLNTFIMAISERTKEIGILSAIGWSRSMIISVFLIESLLLSFIGGIIGFLLSYPIIVILQKVFINIYSYLSSMPDISVFINVMLMCLVIGILSVVFPALYGTKIHIAKAIRYE